MEPTGEAGFSHRPAASDVGRAEGCDQDAASGSNDGGRNPQICTHAEVGRKHLRSGCGIHPGVDNTIQSGESPHGTEMAKLVNSAALSLIGLRLRPEKLQLSPLAKALAGMKQ